MEQFEMEQLVYTQDDIFMKMVKHTLQSKDKTTEDMAGISRASYPKLLKAYYEVQLT